MLLKRGTTGTSVMTGKSRVVNSYFMASFTDIPGVGKEEED